MLLELPNSSCGVCCTSLLPMVSCHSCFRAILKVNWDTRTTHITTGIYIIHTHTHIRYLHPKWLAPCFSLSDGSFLRTIATSLIDFNELSSVAALNQLLEVRLCKVYTLLRFLFHFNYTICASQTAYFCFSHHVHYTGAHQHYCSTYCRSKHENCFVTAVSH